MYTLDLGEGETLKLPPTPEQLSIFEGQGIQDEEDIQREKEEKAYVKLLPPPPRHPHAKNSRARASDISLLEGRKALRSPEPGLSASACNSPNLDSDFDGTFRSPTRTEMASPRNSPPRSIFDAEEEISRLSLQQQDKGKAAEVVEPEPTSIPLPPDAASRAEPSMIPVVEHETASASEPDAFQPLALPVPPPLEHHDTSTSSISMYSAQEEESIPPPYDPSESVISPPEKQAGGTKESASTT